MIPTYSQDIKELIELDKEVVPAKVIGKILGIHPSQIISEAKDGTWDRSICNYVIAGKRVKFLRVDFLKKGGWI